MNRAAAPKSDPGAAQGVMGYGRLILLVVLPFAGGYFLSSFYRTITAVISAELSSSMDLRACWFPRARGCVIWLTPAGRVVVACFTAL